MSPTDLPLRSAESTLAEINDAIERLIVARSTRVASYGSEFAELWSLSAKCLRGGKLLRPRLLIGAFDALSETTKPGEGMRSEALKIAAALEVLHFAFLLHDDLIDEDLFRRGEPNLIGHLASLPARSQTPDTDRFGAATRRLHWARSSALLVGDLMLTIAHQEFARARVIETGRIRMLDLLDETVTETVAGEHYDVGLADGRILPELHAVLNMTRMKTAAYTFELPLRVAAVLAGADKKLEEQLGEVGSHLGIAFQLQDDLLSAFGLSEVHGKDQFSDFRERKETALMAFARNTKVWPQIDHHLSSTDLSEESGRVIQRLLSECGARAFIESMIQDQIRSTLEKLSQRDGGALAPVSRFVQALVDSIDGRNV